MAIVKKLTKRGFTLIELMIVVVIIGILAALAIYGVQKYVANSKSAEARQMLGRMSKDMLTFFEGENQRYEILDLGGSAEISQALCPAADPLPSAPPSRGKVLLALSDFSDSAGWQCLGTTITTPIYYAYNMESSQAGSLAALSAASANDSFDAIAQGDLDGDGDFSTFTMGGIVRDGGNGLQLVLATTVQEENPEE